MASFAAIAVLSLLFVWLTARVSHTDAPSPWMRRSLTFGVVADLLARGEALGLGAGRSVHLGSRTVVVVAMKRWTEVGSGR